MGLLDFLKKGTEKPAEPAKNTSAPGNKPYVQPTPASTTNVAKPAQVEPQTYTVQSGDSLSKIAKHLYGDANKWNKIFEANKDIVKNPDLIKPGQILKIPKL